MKDSQALMLDVRLERVAFEKAFLKKYGYLISTPLGRCSTEKMARYCEQESIWEGWLMKYEQSKAIRSTASKEQGEEK